MMPVILRSILILICLVFLTGCRAWNSDKPAVHVNPNFDWQAKYKPQQLAMKSPDGVVPWGSENSYFFTEKRADALQSDSRFYRGKTSTGQWIRKIPVAVTEKLLLRGQEQYNIYCAVCHTKTGNGTKSVISKRGWVVPDITMTSSRQKRDGELYDIVSHGIRSMPGYAKQIDFEDRWAIVSYVRALQAASKTTLNNVPSHLRDKIK
eukprot:SAG22_NODE_2460_length_2546_cov_1.366980_2_plen_207_part_00